MAIEVTEEMRQAVYAADCQHWGHQFDFRSALGATDAPNPNDPRGFPLPVLIAPVEGQMPHLFCTRCGWVWLVIDEPGIDYDDAVTKVAARLAALTPDDTAPLTPSPVAGFGDRPIPLAPGVVWDNLRDDHPARRYRHQRTEEQALQQLTSNKEMQ